eukprot:9316958-Pyramimonas_sp.AAC.1
MDSIPTYDVPLCSTGEGDRCGLDSDEHGQRVELCVAADMSELVLSEQQRDIRLGPRDHNTASICGRRRKTTRSRQGGRPPCEVWFPGESSQGNEGPSC